MVSVPLKSISALLFWTLGATVSIGQVTFTFDVTPKPQILLGKTLTGIVNDVQPQQADEVSWKFRCANQNTGWQLALEQPELTKAFCAGKVGDHLVEANVRVNLDSAIKSVAIEVLGPTTLNPTSTMAAKSDTGPPLFNLEHRFRLLRGPTLGC